MNSNVKNAAGQYRTFGKLFIFVNVDRNSHDNL